eukprot:4500114-Pleurochrysis_carterae.AAC.2
MPAASAASCSGVHPPARPRAPSPTSALHAARPVGWPPQPPPRHWRGPATGAATCGAGDAGDEARVAPHPPCCRDPSLSWPPSPMPGWGGAAPCPPRLSWSPMCFRPPRPEAGRAAPPRGQGDPATRVSSVAERYHVGGLCCYCNDMSD